MRHNSRMSFPILTRYITILMTCMTYAFTLGQCILGCSKPTSAAAIRQSGHQSSTKPAGPLDSEQLKLLLIFRTESISGDQTHITDIRKWLASDNSSMRAAAMCALSRLGDADSLPAFDKLIGQYPDSWESNFARVLRARTVAEAAANQFDTPESKANARVAAFLAELNINAVGLNRSMTEPRKIDDQDLPPFAVRQLADMALRNPSKYYLDRSEFKLIDWSKDPFAFAKIQLAPLSDTERIRWLVGALCARSIRSQYENALIQLLADMGLPASDACAIKLAEMEANQSAYKRIGFDCLVEAISANGDKRYADICNRIEKNITGQGSGSGFNHGRKSVVYFDY